MVRESVNALARACGQQELPRSAGHVEIAGRAGSFDARLAPGVGRALALTRARRVDG